MKNDFLSILLKKNNCYSNHLWTVISSKCSTEKKEANDFCFLDNYIHQFEYINPIISEQYQKTKKKTGSLISIGVSLFLAIIYLIIMFACQDINNLIVFKTYIPISLFVSLGLFVYTIVTISKRKSIELVFIFDSFYRIYYFFS